MQYCTFINWISFDLSHTGFHKGDIRPFLVEGQQVGLIKSDVYKQLLKYPEVFCIRDCEYTKQVIIERTQIALNQQS